MCVICYKPKGVILEKTILENCFFNNPHGAGFGIIQTDEETGEPSLDIVKGIFDFETFWTAWEPHQEKQALIHFRISTQGTVDANNSHPFRVNDNLILAHNGRLPALPDHKELSDTAIFVDQIVKPLAEANPDFWMLESFEWFFERSITTSNKIVMMDVKGNYKIFNSEQGTWRHGCWFSNYSFTSRQSTFSQRFHDRPTTTVPTQTANPVTPPKINTTPVIDVKAEVISTENDSNSTTPFKELESLEEEFDACDLNEIDQRLESLQHNQR